VVDNTNPDILLDCQDVSRSFGGLKAVDGVSMQVTRGQIVGIIGPNGAGKTTLFNLISGQLPVSSGRIIFNGEDVTSKPPHARARRGMGRTFQIVHPIATLSVLENVMIGAFGAYPRRHAAEKRAVEILDRVELTHRAADIAGELTLADRKRLEVARALAGNTTLLLLDEVMAGLNPSEANAAISMIRRLGASGLSIVLIEHNLKVVRDLAEQVVVLDHGAEIAAGLPDVVLKDPEVIRAYLGDRKVGL